MTTRRDKTLTDTVVFRCEPSLHQGLKNDAERHGRTVAQTIRFYLEMVVQSALSDCEECSGLGTLLDPTWCGDHEHCSPVEPPCPTCKGSGKR